MQKSIAIKANSLKVFGYLKKTNGIKGDLLLVPDQSVAPESDLPAFLFFVIDGLPVPFKVEAYDWRGDDNISVSFSYIDSKEKAQVYVGSKIMTDSTELLADDEINPLALETFSIRNEHGTFCGEIIAVDNYGGNIVLTVISGSSEYLIPFHPDLVLSFNNTSRSLVIEIPEGLIE